MSWNPERIRSLAGQDHQLWGLWARSMAWDQGPYPVLDGSVTTVSLADAPATIAREQIDVVYALFQVYDPELWGPTPPGITHDVWTLLRSLFAARACGEFDAPIVFHWGFDVHHLDPDVVAALDGQIFCNREQHAYWTTPVAQGGAGFECFGTRAVTGFLDSDRTKAEFANDDFAPLLSAGTGEHHTVCVGRPFNLDYAALAREGIHLHVYGNGHDDTIRMIADDLRRRDATDAVDAVARVVHVHESLQPTGHDWPDVRDAKARWVHEFSRYDAGWSYLGLPFPWVPLEHRAAIPNRLSTYLLAGLPVITDVMPDAYRYTELVRLGVNVDLVDDDYAQLRASLVDEAARGERRTRARAARHGYTFDASITELVELLTLAHERYLARDATERRAPLPGTPARTVAVTRLKRPTRRSSPGALLAHRARSLAAFAVGPSRRARREHRHRALEDRLRAGMAR